MNRTPNIQEFIQLAMRLGFIQPAKLNSLKALYQQWIQVNPQDHFYKFFILNGFLTQGQLQRIHQNFQASQTATLGKTQTLAQQDTNLGKTQTFPQQKMTAGHIWANFEILEEIGRGGMGVVYKAQQKNLARVVALKLLISGEITDQYRKRFLREAELGAQLEHPNIVKTYTASIHGETPYIAMEFIEGESFLSYSQKHSLRENIQVIERIAEALQHAHEKGIVHRDIKPSNILVDKAGKPYLTDFGLARNIRIEDKSLTRTGQVLGTPQYMSPEQAKGRKKNLDNKTDIYALGAILYEIATGERAFSGNNPVEILYKVVASSPMPPHCIDPEIDENLETIILKSMSYRKDDRYAEAKILSKDLRNYLEGKAISASSKNRGILWLEYHKALLCKISLSLIVFLSLVLVSLSFLKEKKTVSSSKPNYKQALSFFKQKQYKKSMFFLEKYLRKFPLDKRAIYLKAHILDEQFVQAKDKDFQKKLLESMSYAWEDLYKLSKKEKDLKYLNYIGKAAFLHKKFKSAKKYNQKILQFSFDDQEIKERMFCIFLQEGKYKKAQEISKKRIRSLQPFCKAISTYHEGSPEKAYKNITQLEKKQADSLFLGS